MDGDGAELEQQQPAQPESCCSTPPPPAVTRARQQSQSLTQQQQHVQEWQRFASRQAQRYVPAPRNPSRRRAQEPACHRLRVLHVDGLPAPQLPSGSSGTTFGLQLGVTLFDEAVGQFYGSTCCSAVEPLQQPLSDADDGAGSSSEAFLDFSFDVLFHTTISDPHCVAVVELILVEIEADGLCKAKCSAGWAQLPLFMRNKPNNAGSLQLHNKELPVSSQTPAIAPVLSGTPRYLQLRSVCGDRMAPPVVLGSCMVSYQMQAFPAMHPARALLPPDFLVTYSDVIPGLRRVDFSGQASTALKSTLNTLAGPQLAAPCAVSFSGVQLVVPQLLHNLLSVLPQLLGTLPPPDLASMLAVPCQPAAVAYSLRLRLHNGRTFVGPWLSTQLQVQPHLGSLVLVQGPREAAGQQLVLNWLLQDRLMVVVLELLAAPTAPQAAVDDAAAGSQAGGAAEDAAAAGATVGEVLVGRAVLAPFSAVAADGSSATLDAGRHKLCIDSSSCMGSLISGSSCWAPPSGCSSSILAPGCEPGDLLLPLNWRAMLGDAAVRAVPDPTLQLELCQCSAAPQLPQPATAAVVAAAAGDACSVSEACTAADGQLSTLSAAVASPGATAAEVTMPDSNSLTATALPPQPPTPTAAAATVSSAVDAVADMTVQCAREHDTPAARSLKLAAHHLEEAASIPVQTPSSSTCGGRQSQEAQADTAPRQQLQQLSDAMQQQLDMLALAVAELKQERQTLRSSLTVLESTTRSAAAACSAAAGQLDTHQQQQQQQQQQPWAQQHTWQHQGSSSSGPELQWLAAVPEAACHGGGLMQQSHQAYNTPSRAVLQQLHEAGMTRALPSEVQSCLRQQQQQQQQQHHSGQQSCTAALLLDVERRDPRTASDVVLQLLAFRPSEAPAAAALQLPSSLRSVFFTLQFFKSGPMTTDTCLLAASSPQTVNSQHQQQQPDTLMLLPPQQPEGNSHAGAAGAAGLVLKFCVDGSRPSQLLPGQDPAQAAAATHLVFCQYLASHKLAVDMWDGDSLLQLGSCCVDLSGLLRQGRDLADLLLELPLLKDCSQDSGQLQHTKQPQPLGTLLLRLINVGRQPAAGPRAEVAAVSAAPDTPGKKMCVRAVPLEPGSPVAKELRGAGGSNGSPFAVDWQQQQQQQQQQQENTCSASADGMMRGPGCQAGAAAGNDASDAATAADIISFEQRKVAREQQLRGMLLQHSPSRSPTHSSPGMRQQSLAGQLSAAATWSSPSPTKHAHHQQQQQQQQWRPGSPLSTTLAAAAAASDGGGCSASGYDAAAAEPYKALQQQLLSDVEAVRKRQKPGFIRSQLRKSLVTQCTVRASPGQALLLEHTLTNSIGRDAVFELCVSQPHELAAVESLQELRDLQQGVGGASISTGAAAAASGGLQGSSSPAAGGAPQLRQLVQQAAAAGAVSGGAGGGRELASRGRIFLAAHESVSIPLRLALQQSEQQQQQQQQQQQHVVVVEFVPLGLDWPVSILELTVQPEPPIIDRTLRFHCPERELLHVELPLAQLPGVSAAVLAAAAAGRLVVRASRPDVKVTAAHSPAGTQQQQQSCVHLRYRCGVAAQEAAAHFYVWLYADAAAAQPLEGWQVFVHALQRVDMRATVDQHSSTTLAISGGSVDRLVAVYSSHPEELQQQPASTPLSLPAAGLSALGLVFRPRGPGQQRVRVHLVDVNTRRLVHALLVCTDAALPDDSE